VTTGAEIFHADAADAAPQPELGIAAEHGFFTRPPGSTTWHTLRPWADHSWLALALPILKQYQESTDGSYIEVKQSAVVWHYRDADPDFGNWQVRCWQEGCLGALLEHHMS
jgi:trehalose 6-phosphate synthase/phosphatase